MTDSRTSEQPIVSPVNGSAPARAIIAIIRFYQRWISAARPPTCRFYPSCSTYTVEAVECHGPWRGMLLGLRRLAKCHPFHSGGFDPVPTSTVTKHDSD